MRKRITKNTLPFLLLLLIHLIILARVYNKEQNRKQITIMFISQVGLAYIFEYFVLIIGNAYKYKPMLSRKSYLDNVIGAVFSQSFFVPIASLFLIKKNSGWLGKIIASSLFTITELVFRKWKIYKTYWWSPLFTFLLLPVYFKWGQFWYSLLQKRNSVVTFISLFFSIWVTGMNTLYTLAITTSYKFGIGIKHTWREHFLVAPMFSGILSLLATIQVRMLPKKAFTIVMYIEAMIIDVLFLKKGIINSNFRYPVENILGHLIMTKVATVYHDWLYKDHPKNNLQQDDSL